MFELHQGDCLDVLRGLPDNSVDSCVTDPPYGLSDHKPTDVVACLTAWLAGEEYRPNKRGFMGRTWDSWVPGPEVWREVFRVLKPGGHVVAFAGSRTHDLMSMALRLAGFECRDTVMWVYGCLSEDSEVLTEDGWMPYNRAKQKNILVYDLQNDVYQWEKPSRWNEYRVESDTAYRIQSDHTDQIVSRGHRCIVERGGVLTFVPADELSGVERVPYLRSDFSALPEGCGELLLQAVLREGEGLAQEAFSQRQGQEAAREGACWREKPGVEGWRDPLQAQGQVCRPSDQVRSLPCASDEHGAQGRVCDGAQTGCCARDRQAADAAGVCSSHQPRRDGQQAGEPDAVCDQCGSQAVRARASYQTTLATITAIEYSGMIWCPTVSTGAFVARRKGKVFITGNSGFPKSLDVSKAIDKAAGAEREVVGTKVGLPGYSLAEDKGRNTYSAGGRSSEVECAITAPATDAARQWQGWGTALKPAFEPALLFRKPLVGTVAENVLQYGTGALNIDGCRVEGRERTHYGLANSTRSRGNTYGAPSDSADFDSSKGRWPANVILSYPDDEYQLRDDVTADQLVELAGWLRENA